METPREVTHPRFWFLEGLDKVGKTALRKELEVRSGYVLPFYDRGPVSRIMFATINKEPQVRIVPYYILELKLINSGMYGIVYLQASVETVQKRMKQAGEPVLTKNVLASHSAEFDSLIQNRVPLCPVIFHNVEGKTLQQSAMEILQEVYKYV